MGTCSSPAQNSLIPHQCLHNIQNYCHKTQKTFISYISSQPHGPQSKPGSLNASSPLHIVLLEPQPLLYFLLPPGNILQFLINELKHHNLTKTFCKPSRSLKHCSKFLLHHVLQHIEHCISLFY